MLDQDVAWPAIIANGRLRRPAGVFLTGFQGQHTLPTAAAAAAAPAVTTTPSGATGATSTPKPAVDPNDVCAGLTPPAGTVTLTGQAADLATVATFQDQLNRDADLTVLWVTTAKLAGSTGTGPVQFTITASLGAQARGHRLETFFKGASCK